MRCVVCHELRKLFEKNRATMLRPYSNEATVIYNGNSLCDPHFEEQFKKENA